MSLSCAAAAAAALVGLQVLSYKNMQQLLQEVFSVVYTCKTNRQKSSSKQHTKHKANSVSFPILLHACAHYRAPNTYVSVYVCYICIIYKVAVLSGLDGVKQQRGGALSLSLSVFTVSCPS